MAAYALSSFSGRLPEGWQDIGLWVGFCLGTIFLVGLCLHGIKDWRRSEKVEPTDLIMLGLGGMVLAAALTLAGFVWQQYKGPVRQEPVSAASPCNGYREALGKAEGKAKKGQG